MPRRLLTYTKGIALGLWRWAIPTAAIMFSALALVQLYYFAMPGSWFLRYESAQVQSAFEGEPVVATICRTRLIGAVKADATRTFYRSDSYGQGYKSVGTYSFEPTIEAGDRCVDVTVTPERFTHTAGYWKYHTDLNFKVGGYEKTTSFDSNVYRILPKPTNQELQIQLELKIQDLQRQLDELKVSAANMPAIEAPTPDTARTNQPTTSSPPEGRRANPVTPGRPAPRPSGLIESLVNSLLGARS